LVHDLLHLVQDRLASLVIQLDRLLRIHKRPLSHRYGLPGGLPLHLSFSLTTGRKSYPDLQPTQASGRTSASLAGGGEADRQLKPQAGKSSNRTFHAEAEKHTKRIHVPAALDQSEKTMEQAA
jgi:hypothetical protein